MPVRVRSDEEELLRAALALSPDRGVMMLSREPLGEGSVAGFGVQGDGGADGDATVTYYVDTSNRVVAAETGLLLGSPEEPQVRVWVHPADPHLPALPPLSFEHTAETVLGRLGVRAVAGPVFVAYRPGRRAVLRVETDEQPVWVKVVPPARVDRIVRSHGILADHGIPVPRVLGWSDTGLVVLADADGTPATDVEWQPEGLLDEVDALRRRMADVPLPFVSATGLERRLEWYRARLGAVLRGERAGLADAIASAAESRWTATAAADPRGVAVHGDLHFGQLLLGERGRISGLIDVDTAGIGAPDDDAAAFAAHAIASAVLTPEPRDARVWALAEGAVARWCGAAAEGDGCRARIATHLLGHALAAVEVQEHARADALLESAASVLIARGGPR